MVLEEAIRNSNINRQASLIIRCHQCLAYEDDVVLIARSQRELELITGQLIIAAENMGVAITETKSRYMRIQNKHASGGLEEMAVHVQQGRMVKFKEIDSYIYLDTLIDKKCREEAEINLRLAKGKTWLFCDIHDSELFDSSFMLIRKDRDCAAVGKATGVGVLIASGANIPIIPFDTSNLSRVVPLVDLIISKCFVVSETLYMLLVEHNSFPLVNEDSYHPALRYNFRKPNILELYNGVSHVDWTFIEAVTLVNRAVVTFCHTIFSIVDNQVRKYCSSDRSFPIWFYSKTIKLIKLATENPQAGPRSKGSGKFRIPVCLRFGDTQLGDAKMIVEAFAESFSGVYEVGSLFSTSTSTTADSFTSGFMSRR
ncbi:hypothetical protein QE152_g30158 [Popillia japonica]|uniref:Reverse transcriptase domain-containing protein n=1 Tax=Popillia japonica TaxID=7064 RepID=A0AAW1JFR0_POPJA